MCGIVGGIQWRGGQPSPELLRRMAKAMSHRGPDDEGYFFDRSVALGFKRLAIIDLSGGHQPMTTECGRYTIVFNGEVYDYRGLRAVLERDHGVAFRTGSDTEVILYAYRQWGPSAVERLNGMFGLAIWDAQEETLFLARDRFGKKPIYYAETPSGFWFASEIKVLFEHPEISAEVERSRIPAFLAYRYVPGAETLFRGIGCLRPASRMTVSVGKGVGTPERYWDYSFSSNPGHPPVDQVATELRELLDDSVRLRMIADVPVGAFLSGGIDSSLIVALMSAQHPEPVKTFSIGFDAGFSEDEYARLVARRFRTDHHEIKVSSEDLLRNIPAVLFARESPVTEASDIPIFLLSQLARTKVTVALSGEGSDEVFAGYPKYAFAKALGGPLSLLPRAALGRLARSLPFRLRRLQLALQTASEEDRFERHARWFGAFGSRERRELLAPGFPSGERTHAFSEELVRGKSFPSEVEEMLYLDTWHWLAANLLLRGDRMTMAHSLELRCPFLDYRLAEFAAQKIPLGLKIRGGSGKWILKRVAQDLLPREVLARRKWGFRVPTDEWFRGPLQKVLKDTLLSPRALARGYFRERALRAMIEAHITGRTNLDKQLWILFQLELWHLMFIDRTLSPTDTLA
jgi:asparagine synthase (glutamine-hydrolysing)